VTNHDYHKSVLFENIFEFWAFQFVYNWNSVFFIEQNVQQVKTLFLF